MPAAGVGGGMSIHGGLFTSTIHFISSGLENGTNSSPFERGLVGTWRIQLLIFICPRFDELSYFSRLTAVFLRALEVNSVYLKYSVVIKYFLLFAVLP